MTSIIRVRSFNLILFGIDRKNTRDNWKFNKNKRAMKLPNTIDSLLEVVLNRIIGREKTKVWFGVRPA